MFSLLTCFSYFRDINVICLLSHMTFKWIFVSGLEFSVWQFCRFQCSHWCFCSFWWFRSPFLSFFLFSIKPCTVSYLWRLICWRAQRLTVSNLPRWWQRQACYCGYRTQKEPVIHRFLSLVHVRSGFWVWQDYNLSWNPDHTHTNTVCDIEWKIDLKAAESQYKSDTITLKLTHTLRLTVKHTKTQNVIDTHSSVWLGSPAAQAECVSQQQSRRVWGFHTLKPFKPG